MIELMNDIISKIEGTLADEKVRLPLKIGLPFIPVVGSHLETMYKHFLESWDRRKLNEKIDDANAKQVELATHAVFSALHCIKEAKSERILDILSNSLEKSIPNTDEAEDLINIVVELSENEAIVFGAIYKNLNSEENKKSNDMPKITTTSIKNIVPQYKDKIIFYLNRLQGKGLLEEDTGIWREEGKIYKSTMIGQQLFDTFHNS